MTRALCIALHDVAPATWPRCERLLALLRDVGAPPATLLIVPDYHGRGRIEQDRAFVHEIGGRIARGDEIALHGYRHLDDGPAPHTPHEFLRRRVLTAGEGEFAALTEIEAEQRIGAGLLLLDRLGWNVAGFVAPAWLLGPGARAALARTRLDYTSTHTHLESLADCGRLSAPVISASARSAWRRWTSRQWLRCARVGFRDSQVLRVALHPADAEDDALIGAWRMLLRALLADRVALTKSAALAKLRAIAEPAALARA